MTSSKDDNVLLLSRMDVNMQPRDGRCVFGGIPITPLLGEQSSSLHTSVYSKTLVEKREKAEISVQTCVKSEIGQLFDFGFVHTVKT